MLGTVRCRTTSYHPQANGLVERFQWQLKAALKTNAGTSWTESLPLVLLGLRTALKGDLNCTAAELVYGMSLHLPGEFFSPSAAPVATYITRLKQYMRTLHAVPTTTYSSCTSFIDNSLFSTSHVFIRRDFVKRLLEQTYDGPFKVLSRSHKHFIVDINGKQNASFGGLKLHRVTWNNFIQPVLLVAGMLVMDCVRRRQCFNTEFSKEKGDDNTDNVEGQCDIADVNEKEVMMLILF
uniref:Integrase catalytic domain-containing protein n=1 Tax=Amphimedon queenslandica TaxID=400682 RepID=A0A1X7UDL6_AMPQE